jgi:hypothetical protein
MDLEIKNIKENTKKKLFLFITIQDKKYIASHKLKEIKQQP